MKGTVIVCASALLSGCWPFGIGQFFPGPRLQSQYAHNIGYHARLTDGTSAKGELVPCASTYFFRSQPGPPPWWKRTVFLDELIITKDSTVIARYAGEDVEAAGLGDVGTAAVDELGLRTVSRAGTCFRFLNTGREDLQARVIYQDGTESVLTWRACLPSVWSDEEMGRHGRRRNNVARLVVARGSEVLHDLSRAAFKAQLKRWHFREGPQPWWERRPWLDMVLVDESGFTPMAGSQRQAGLGYQSLCSKADSAASGEGETRS